MCVGPRQDITMYHSTVVCVGPGQDITVYHFTVMCVGPGQDITVYHSTVDASCELPHSHHSTITDTCLLQRVYCFPKSRCNISDDFISSSVLSVAVDYNVNGAWTVTIA